MKHLSYGETIQLLTPQGATVRGQIVSVGRWDRPRVSIPTWQQEAFISDLLADGWRIVEHQQN